MNYKETIDSAINYSQRYSLIILCIALIFFIFSIMTPKQIELNIKNQPKGTILINYITAEGKFIFRAPDGSEIPDAILPDRKGNTLREIITLPAIAITSGSPLNIWFTGIDGSDKCIRIDYDFKQKEVIGVLGACK